MNDTYVLEWTFTPADYFEEPTDFSCEFCSIHVENGKAVARVPSDKYPDDHSVRNQLHGELDSRFMGAQVLSHKPYTLSKSNVSRLHLDGRKDVWAFVEGARIAITGGTVDFVLRGADGGVIRDTKQERVERRFEFSQLAARYINDPVANAILRSYAAAVKDPQNELIHLYEIRDALSKHFGGEATALAKGGLSQGQWSRFGRLANSEPLIQGRHRGKQPGALRNATTEELTEARDIAREMIRNYLRQL